MKQTCEGASQEKFARTISFCNKTFPIFFPTSNKKSFEKFLIRVVAKKGCFLHCNSGLQCGR